MTAMWFLKKAQLGKGEHILIYGDSGSVGSFAVQLAKHFGAKVTAVCSESNVEMVKSLGATFSILFNVSAKQKLLYATAGAVDFDSKAVMFFSEFANQSGFCDPGAREQTVMW